MAKVEIIERHSVWRHWVLSGVAVISLVGVSCVTSRPVHSEPPRPRPDDDSAVVEKIRQNSRGLVSLQKGGSSFEVALYAPDEKVSLINGDYCRANTGAKNYSGTYQLVSIGEGRVVARTLLETSFEFVYDGVPEGMFALTMAKQEDVFVIISQYMGCNGNSLYFYRIDSAGKCHAVMLIGWNSEEAARLLKFRGPSPAPTRRSVFASPGIDGAPLGVKVEGDSVVVGHYNNAEGKSYLEWFTYDGENLRLTKSCTGIPTPCEDFPVQPR